MESSTGCYEGSSLSFDTRAELLIDLMENYRENVPKVLNTCGDDNLSKYDIELMMADKLGVNSGLVIPISTVASQGIFEARRAFLLIRKC